MYELEAAICDFEKVFDCRITIHRLGGIFGRGEFMPVRSSHRRSFPCCMAEERDYCVRNCMFDFNRRVARDNRRYYLKRCRNQYIEVAAPLYRHGNHVGTVFAGLWKRPADPVKIRQLCNLLPVFAEGLLRYSETLQYTPGDFRLKERIREFIAYNFNKPVSVKDLAGELSLSVSRTCHLVKSLFDRNFSELLTAERLNYARFHLNGTDYRMHEIARLCGFGSAEHFNRIFTARYGIPPREYRRRTQSPE